MTMTAHEAALKFNLTDETLTQMSAKVSGEIQAGLTGEKSSLKSLPTLIPIEQESEYQGQCAVMDLGGSNLRAAQVNLNGQGIQIEQVTNCKMPWQRGVSFAKESYLNIQADALGEVMNQDLSLGYCFSFPARSSDNGDAHLVEWTKGVNVPNMQGELVGQTLVDQVKQNHGLNIPDVAVINDTVASLLAGLTDIKADAYLGLIAGTGSNMAGLYPAEMITSAQAKTLNVGSLSVNLESGNFSPDCLNEYDDVLDAGSENPGLQRFEKAVSGMYLGRLYKLSQPDSDFEPSSGALGINQLIDGAPENTGEHVLACAIMQRSADLVAAQIFGAVCHFIKYANADAKVFQVTCEGGLFWSSSEKLGAYKTLVERRLGRLLTFNKMPGICIHLSRVEHANLVGSAIAALANHKS